MPLNKPNSNDVHENERKLLIYAIQLSLKITFKFKYIWCAFKIIDVANTDVKIMEYFFF